MCWYVFIATSKPLEGVLFTQHLPKGQPPPPLHFQEVEEGDEKERYIHLFQGNYVGSTSGCSCHLDYSHETLLTPEFRAKFNIYSEEDEEYKHSPQLAPKAFLDFIRAYVQKNDFLEMYTCWRMIDTVN